MFTLFPFQAQDTLTLTLKYFPLYSSRGAENVYLFPRVPWWRIPECPDHVSIEKSIIHTFICLTVSECVSLVIHVIYLLIVIKLFDMNYLAIRGIEL